MAEESRFAKIARIRVTESAANALTFNEFSTGAGLQAAATKGKGTAWLIDQIDYYVRNIAAALLAAPDTIAMGITTSDAVPALQNLEDQRILHAMELVPLLVTSGLIQRQQPFTHQFFPALLWAEPTLFGAVQGNSLPVAGDVVMRILYRTIELDQQLIFEVAQAFRIIS